MRRPPDVDPRNRVSTEAELLGALRLALFSGNYNYVREGANQALNRLAGYLIERGARVRVYSPTTRSPAFEPVGDLVSVPSIALPLRSEFRVALGLPRSVRRDIAAFRPSLVHLSTPDWLGTSAQRLARKLGLPVVASFHTRFETYFQHYGLKPLARWAWRRQRRFYLGCDRILVPNYSSMRHIEEMGVPANRLRIWSRGVDAELFSPKRRDLGWRRQLGFGDEDIVILYFGRIVREKGIREFADTVTLLRRRQVPIRALVVGEGPARAEFRALLGDAQFAGHLEGEALGRAVASADIFLNPSLTETFGNVNLEAMAAGLCIVSANSPSASELIEDGRDGFLSPPVARAFADLIEKLIQRPEERLDAGLRAVSSASNYSWPSILAAVASAYLELMGASPTLEQRSSFAGNKSRFGRSPGDTDA